MIGTRSRVLIVALAAAILIALLAVEFRSVGGDRVTETIVAAADEFSSPEILDEKTDLERRFELPGDRSASVQPLKNAAGPAPLAVQGSIAGRVLDSSGAPIVDAQWARVSLYDSWGERRESGVGDSGRFELRDLPLGAYSLRAEATGFLRFEDTVTFTVDRADLSRDVTLDSQPRIRIRVLAADGRELREALGEFPGPLFAVATRESPGQRLAEVRGSINNPFGVGSFWHSGPPDNELGDEYLGMLSLHAQLPVYVSLVHYQHVLRTVEVAPGQDEVTFVLPVEEWLADFATLRFRVVDASSGEPIAEGNWRLWGWRVYSKRLGVEGAGSIDRVDPGRYHLRISAQAHESWEGTLDLEPGVVTDLGALSLGRGVRAFVRVADREGNPRSARFRMRSLDPESRSLVESPENVMVSTEKDGTLELKNFGRGLYCLQAGSWGSPPGGEPMEPGWLTANVLIDTREGGDVEVDVVSEPASRLVLSLDESESLGCSYGVEDDRGLPVATGRFEGRVPRQLEVVPGSYEVVLRDRADAEISRRLVTVGAEAVLVTLSR